MTTEPGTAQPQFSAADIGAIAHLYRGEMYRSKVWRTRLDATTNWAVVTTGIAMSVAFSAADATPLPIVLISFLVTVFWVLEARRYRLYDVWRTRVRVLEANFYSPLLRGQGARTDQRWNQVLADDYTGVYFHIGYLEALGRRLRRNYAWIFAVQVVSYWSKLSIHPVPIASLEELWSRAAVGPVPGQAVLAIGTVFYFGLLVLGLATLRGQRAVGRPHAVRAREDHMQLLASTEMY
ncbi:MAG TPA: DUF2270 domain-containing protein [Geminicoccaceae bacterium]|jgi:uncharacterized membrane protein|nr:DUF2270 domain-containing protein [Geminicoccaceae bacterium]HZA65620.1 DUF2270 domain-containing protein [Geminicoccaceae bacterium]